MKCIAFNEIDFESNGHTQKFVDGLYMMKNIAPRTGMSIVFDVKRLAQGQTVYESFGFSVIPIFSQLMNEEEKLVDFFINSGIYQVHLIKILISLQLPIYKGVLTADFIQQLRVTQDPLALIQQQSAKYTLSDSTLIVEIVDNQREVSDVFFCKLTLLEIFGKGFRNPHTQSQVHATYCGTETRL